MSGGWFGVRVGRGVVGVLVGAVVGVLVFPAVVVGAVSVPVDQGPDGQWWFAMWRIGQVWDAGARGQRVTVAVIDGGVQADRSELAGVVLPGTGGPDGKGQIDTDTEKRSHGTGMAILVAGQGGDTGLTGIAPDSRILPVSRVNGDGKVAEDIRWAADHGARVINMSFTGGADCVPDVAEAVRYAIGEGAILVSGSGNFGGSGAEAVGAPANCPGVVAVSAVDSQARSWSGSDTGPVVDLAAPGVHTVVVTNDGTRYWPSGTSVSTALVSGVMALVWSAHPELTNRQVVARVLATAKDAGDPGRDDEYGFGVARPWQAVTQDVPADAANAVFDEIEPGFGSAATLVSAAPETTSSLAPVTAAQSGANDSGVPVWVWVGAGAGAVMLIIVMALLAARATRT